MEGNYMQTPQDMPTKKAVGSHATDAQLTPRHLVLCALNRTILNAKAGMKEFSPLFDQMSDLDCCIETGKVLAAMQGTSQDHW